MTETTINAIDKSTLVRIEIFSDCKTADIKMMTPVLATGNRDPDRPLKFFSSVTVVFGGRQFPCHFEIPADSLQNAIFWFQSEAQKASDKMLMDIEAQQIKRSILMPSGASVN